MRSKDHDTRMLKHILRTMGVLALAIVAMAQGPYIVPAKNIRSDTCTAEDLLIAKTVVLGDGMVCSNDLDLSSGSFIGPCDVTFGDGSCGDITLTWDGDAGIDGHIEWEVEHNQIHISPSLLIDHTAAENDDHAFEIDLDAAGFSDVKAFEIDYVTGAITSGENEAVMLINIDETAATGGDIVGLEILATEGSADLITGVFVGVGIGPIEQLSGVFEDADSILNKAVDVLTALSGGGAGNISVFVADLDTVTVGNSTKFEELEIIIDTGASGAGIKPTWEFSTGVGTWTSFGPTDGTNAFKNTGVIAWLDSDIPTWAVGTGSEYLIRITRTRASLATTPIVDKVQIAAATEYSWDKDGKIDQNLVQVDGTTCIDADSDRLYHDTDCDDTKDGGEEYIDQASGAGVMVYQWTAAGASSQACAAPDTWEAAAVGDIMVLIGNTTYGGTIGSVTCAVKVTSISGGTYQLRLQDTTAPLTICTIVGITAAGYHEGTGSSWPTDNTDVIRWEQLHVTSCSAETLLVGSATVFAKE